MHKYSFEEEMKSLSIEKVQHKRADTTFSKQNNNSRLEAFRLMKKDVVKDPNLGIADCTEHIFNPLHQTITDKPLESTFKKGDKSLLHYYKNFVTDQDEKFKNRDIEIDSEQHEKPQFDVNVEQLYTLGCLPQSGVVFHKRDKWVAYTQGNTVVIEDFNTKKQLILSDSPDKLENVVLSHNNAVLAVYSNSARPSAYFYDTRKEFTLLSELKLKQSEITALQMPSSGHLAVLAVKASERETVILVYNFTHKEIMTTTSMNLPIVRLEFNIFLENLEFVSLASEMYTFWRITKESTLQYQHGQFEDQLGNRQFTTTSYSPPLSFKCIILLLVALEDGEIWGVDTKTNSLLMRFEDFNFKVNRLLCGLNNVVIVSETAFYTYKMPSIKDIKHDNLNIFCADQKVIEMGSSIVAFDMDIIESEEAVCLTAKGALYAVDFFEKMAVKLSSNTDPLTEIVAVKLVPKDSSAYALKNMDEIFEEPEDQSDSKYFLAIAYRNGSITLFYLPEFESVCSFDVPTEEITAVESLDGQGKLIVGYKGGVFRFFDLNSQNLVGKYSTGVGSDVKSINALPDGEHLFWVDDRNTVSLLKIEEWSPLQIQNHQILNSMGEIRDFGLSPLEAFNKFFLNVGSVYISIYNRKYTNVMRNLSYNNAVPQFYLQDKFPVDMFCRTEVEREAVGSIEEFYCEFSPLDKALIYIVSRARRLLILRNYETHNNIKLVELDFTPLSYKVSPNAGFVSVVDSEGELRIFELEHNRNKIVSSGLKGSNKFSLDISGNSRLVAFQTKGYLRLFEVDV